MRKILQKSISLLLPITLALNGCSINKSPSNSVNNQNLITIEKTQTTAIPFEIQVDPLSFELSFLVDNKKIPISNGTGSYKVENYKEENNHITWSYPEEQIKIDLTPKDNYLSVEITSEKTSDNTFVWPNISAEQYYIPFGEGKAIPADASEWKQYLNQNQLSVMEQLSMPFWISSNGEYCVLFIMEDPFRTQMNFSAEPDISFSISHEYPEIDDNRTSCYRIYLTNSNPVNSAKLYRDYVIKNNNFITLKQKAEQNSNIEKLYGAPFIYLWGDFIISSTDIEWNKFRQSVNSPILQYLYSFSDNIENGKEFKNVLNELNEQDYVAEYQKNIICNYISKVILEDNFWNPELFVKSNDDLNTLLKNGYENLTISEKIQVHKHALAANMPEVFHDANFWLNDSTIALINDMKESGIERAWIGLNSWEQAYAKPELVEQAINLDYLLASYDSYHSIHEPGNEQWITAKFDDTSLYEHATVIDKNGKKESGFQNVGRKLNPTLSLDSVKKRMEQIMSNSLPFNSWFIDCDATGEIYDDYTPEHITTQEQDLTARLERMSYIKDQYNFVIGSEGGNDFAASTITFAHGIELKSFSWMDEDMKSNKDSEYYIGKYYNSTGGVAEHFSKRIPVKEQYFSVFVNPKYDIPLFKLVYNDSVITSYHWDWSTFKIQGATQDRMIREVLYNIPPLYHLDAEEWEKYKQDIVNHQTVWSKFSKLAITEEMTDFVYLTDDGAVQKTLYGDKLIAVANFDDTIYEYETEQIPPHSVLIVEDGQSTIYTPVLKETSR